MLRRRANMDAVGLRELTEFARSALASGPLVKRVHPIENSSDIHLRLERLERPYDSSENSRLTEVTTKMIPRMAATGRRAMEEA